MSTNRSLTIVQTTKFKRDIKQLKERGAAIDQLLQVVELIVNGVPLPEKYKSHKLKGMSIPIMECHIKPDWLLLYSINAKQGILYLIGTGTHSDLF